MKINAELLKVIIAFFVVVLSFSYFFITYFQGKAQSDPQVIIAIVAALTQVLNYFFGSSQSSAKKDEAIVNMSSSIPDVKNQSDDTKK